MCQKGIGQEAKEILCLVSVGSGTVSPGQADAWVRLLVCTDSSMWVWCPLVWGRRVEHGVARGNLVVAGLRWPVLAGSPILS